MGKRQSSQNVVLEKLAIHVPRNENEALPYAKIIITTQMVQRCWHYSSWVEHLPSMCETLHLILSAAERKMIKDIRAKTVTCLEGRWRWRRCHTCPADCCSGAILLSMWHDHQPVWSRVTVVTYKIHWLTVMTMKQAENTVKDRSLVKELPFLPRRRICWGTRLSPVRVTTPCWPQLPWSWREYKDS